MQAGFKSLQRDKTERGVRSEGGEVSDDGEDIGSAAAAYGALPYTCWIALGQSCRISVSELVACVAFSRFFNYACR